MDEMISSIDPSEPLVCEDVQIGDLKQLAVMTVAQALRDAARGRIEQQLDAVLWLVGEDSGFWLEWAGLPYADPIMLITSGQAKTARTTRRYR